MKNRVKVFQYREWGENGKMWGASGKITLSAETQVIRVDTPVFTDFNKCDLPINYTISLQYYQTPFLDVYQRDQLQYCFNHAQKKKGK